jgi:hypothetical protein
MEWNFSLDRPPAGPALHSYTSLVPPHTHRWPTGPDPSRPDSAWTGPAPRDPDLAPLTIFSLILSPSRGTATQCSVSSTWPAPRSTRSPKASPPRARLCTHFPAHSRTQPHGFGSRADPDPRGPRSQRQLTNRPIQVTSGPFTHALAPHHLALASLSPGSTLGG